MPRIFQLNTPDAEPVFYLSLSLFQFLTLVGLTIYFIISLDMGIIGIYYAKIGVFFTLSISMFFFLIKTLNHCYISLNFNSDWFQLIFIVILIHFDLF